MGEQSGDKTEEPTPHKLREARKKGQIVKSKEVTTAFLVLVSYYMFKANAEKMWITFNQLVVYIYSFIPQKLDKASFGILLSETTWSFIFMLMPLFLSLVATTLVVEVLQTQFNASLDPIMPKLSKLNPIEGFKRMFSLKGVVELIKSILKIGIVFYIAYIALMQDLDRILSVSSLPLMAFMTLTGEIVMKIITRVGIFYLFIAALDYLYQRHEFMKNMRMSKQEIKEEYKKLEGDPQIKQRMRQMQREAAMSRSMGKVPGADVVVTNPTHYAVAIKYDASIMKAPQVVAKGQRRLAAQIKAIAEESHVPIIENVDVARALFASTEIGDDIPSDLFRAVAEILAFVFDLKKKKKKKPPIPPNRHPKLHP